MIKRIVFLATLALVAASCTNVIDSVDYLRMRMGDDDVVYATIEGGYEDGGPETKVFADAKMRVLWNADDRISLFNKYSFGYQYRFTGKDGANAGSFKKVPTDDIVTGNPLDNVYAVYPYSEETSVDNDGVLTLTLPAGQTYKENSFGIGANTMVSVTSSGQLMFRNVGGYLSFKFFGKGISVKSITLTGNGGEKLAGEAVVTMPLGGTPTTAMQPSATETLTLTCTTPVALGDTENDFVEFWFVVPPTTFTGGFTVTVTDNLGGTFQMKTTKKRVIERNALTRMSPVEVVPTYKFVPFEDANFKAYCVAFYDTDHDGEISMEEAAAITRLKINTDYIASLGGIEFFHNLTYLRCNASTTYTDEEITYQGKLTALDVSHNAKLDTLYCQRNPNLTSLSFPSASIKYLNCSYNGLKELNLNNCPQLKTLLCNNTEIEDLDLSSCPSLETLYCQGPLKSNDWDSSIDDWATGRQYTAYGILKRLNVSNCRNLKYLNCTSHGENLTEVIGLADCVNLEQFLGFYCDFKQLDFSNNPKLYYLYLSGNINLASLNITNCPELDWMSIWDCRKLTSLDLSHNKKLHTLYYTHLQGVNMSDLVSLLTLQLDRPAASVPVDLSPLVNLQTFNMWHFPSLDLSHNTNLISLWIGSSDCRAIDLSPLAKLESLKIEWFGAETLDVSNNLKLTSFNTASYENLKTLYVAPSQQIEGVTVNRSDEKIHPNTKIEVLGSAFSDPVFLAYMLEHYDTDGSGWISDAEAAAVESIDIQTNDIVSLSGIEKCTNLRFLRCVGTDGNLGTGGLATLDVSKNTKLKELYVHNNKLKELNLSANAKIEQINAGGNPLTSFSTTGLSALKTLILENCTLTSVDLSGAPLLEDLDVGTNQLSKLTLSSSPKLKWLRAFRNPMTSIDLKSCPDLVCIDLSDSQVSSLDFSAQSNITELGLNCLPIAFKDLPDLTRYDLISLHICIIASTMPADYLRHFPNLKWVNFACYQGSSIDLSLNTKLESVWCGAMANMEKMDLSKAPNLVRLNANDCAKLKKVYVKKGVQFTEELTIDDGTDLVYIDGDFLTVSPLSFNVAAAGETILLDVQSNLETLIDLNGATWITQTAMQGAPYGTICFKVAANTGEPRTATIRISTAGGDFTRDVTVRQTGGQVSIPDAVFKQYMVEHFDTNHDGEIDYDEAAAVESIDIQTDDIVSLQGVEACTNLIHLGCVGTDGSQAYGSGKLAYVDVTNCPKLESLVLYHNRLTSLDISKCPKLKHLHPARNLLTELDVTHNPELVTLFTDFNRLTSIDLSKNPKLEKIYLWDNQLTTLDLSACKNIQEIHVQNNQLTTLIVSGCSKAWYIDANNNHLTSFSTTGLSSLKNLHLTDCRLTSVNLSGAPLLEDLHLWNNDLTSLNVSGNTQLKWLHVSDNELTSIDLRNCPNLKSISLQDNKISSLDLSGQTELSEININNLPIAFSDLPDLTRFNLVSLHLSSIARTMPADYLRNFPNLESLNFWGYKGTSIDLTQNTKLKELWCGGLPNMQKLNLAKAPKMNLLVVKDSPNLKKVYLKNDVQLNELEKDSRTDLVYIDGDFLTVSPTSFNVGADGGSIVVNAESNLDIQVSLNNATWITQTAQQSNPLGTYTFDIASSTIRMRSGTITFSTAGGSFSQNVTIRQAGEQVYNIGDIVNCNGIGIVCGTINGSVLLMSVGELAFQNWANSNTWCNNYGEGGWRMPTIDELSLIASHFTTINESLSANRYTTLTTDNYCHWSGTVNPNNSNYYYRERLNNGTIYSYGSDEHVNSKANYTRAVRFLN